MENNHDVSQRTYYVTIHQAKLKKDKTNELEMHIVGLEDYDPHGKTFRYSSFKLNEANEYLRSSTNFFNLLSHYFPLQFSIAEEGILIDSAGFFEKLLDKSEEFAFQEQMTRDTKFLFLNDYKNLLNDIYFVVNQYLRGKL